MHFTKNPDLTPEQEKRLAKVFEARRERMYRSPSPPRTLTKRERRREIVEDVLGYIAPWALAIFWLAVLLLLEYMINMAFFPDAY